MGELDMKTTLANAVSALCSLRKNYEEPGVGLWDDVSRFIGEGNAALAAAQPEAEAARRSRFDSLRGHPTVRSLWEDLMKMQVSTADPSKRMNPQDARDMAAALYSYDHKARSIRGVCYSVGDRTVITYRAEDSIGGVSREKMTFVYNKGSKS